MRVTLPLTFFIMIFCSPSFATIYQWVNEQGIPSYSQHPPPNKSKSFKEIHTKTTRPESAPQQKSSSPDSEADAPELSRKQEKERQQQIKEGNAEMQKVCADVKQNLAVLERGGNPLFKDTDGNYLRLDETAKDKKRQQNQQFLRDNCQ